MKLRLLLMTSLLFLSLASVNALTEIYDCQALNIEREIYILQNNISNAEDCFEIEANNVTLDLNGYSLAGGGSEYGVIIEDYSFTTIKNGYFEDFDEAIFMEHSSNNNIVNLKIKDSTGVYLDGISPYNNFINISVSDSLIDFKFEGHFIENCEQNIVNFIGSDGNPVRFYNKAVVLNDLNARDLILCNADNSKLRNVRIERENNDEQGGIFIYYTDNSLFVDVTLNNTEEGVLLENSNGNIFRRLNLTFNENSGINLYNSHDNKIAKAEISFNRDEGIILEESSSNIIRDSLIESNDGGIFLENSFDNLIKNNVLKLNEKGIEFDSSSENIIRGNKIKNNYELGISLDGSSDNRIFNNLFNNNLNLEFDDFLSNFWNVELRERTNIIGGSFIGGNYWATPNGDGFSQTCEDSDDNGICDEAYQIGENNIDNYPLTY